MTTEPSSTDAAPHSCGTIRETLKEPILSANRPRESLASSLQGNSALTRGTEARCVPSQDGRRFYTRPVLPAYWRELDDDTLAPIAWVEKLTGYTTGTIRRYARIGRLPAPVPYGTRGVRWRLGDLRAWLAAKGRA